MKDLVLTVLDCGLETQSHALVLAALGQFAQKDGFTRMSMTAIGARGRQDVKTVGRILKRLADEDTKTLARDGARDRLLVVAKPPVGRSQSGVYRVHWERLELVARAVRVARRSIMAGAETALIESGFAQAPASEKACLGVLSALRQAVKLEGDSEAAAEIVKLQASLCEALAGWPETAMGGALEVAFEDAGRDPLDGDQLPVDKWGEKVTQNPKKGDAKSLKGDPASHPPTPPYKDSSPQGKSSGAHTPARGAPSAASMGERAEGRIGEASSREVHQLLTPQHFAAIVAGAGDSRAKLLEALIGSQIAELDGLLRITVSCPDQQGRVIEALGWRLIGLCGPKQRWNNWVVNVREAS